MASGPHELAGSPPSVVGFQLKNAPLFLTSQTTLDRNEQRTKVYVDSENLLQHTEYSKIPMHMIAVGKGILKGAPPVGMHLLDARRLQNDFLAGAEVEQRYDANICAEVALGPDLSTRLVLAPSATHGDGSKPVADCPSERPVKRARKQQRGLAEFFERYGFVLLKCPLSTSALQTHADGSRTPNADYVKEIQRFIKDTLYGSCMRATAMDYPGRRSDSADCVNDAPCAHCEPADGVAESSYSTVGKGRVEDGEHKGTARPSVNPEIVGFSDRFLTLRGITGPGPYAAGAHQDFDHGVERLKWRDGSVAALATEWEANPRLGGIDVLNFWRVVDMHEPLRHMPLALCDPLTVSERDIVSKLHTSFRGEIKDGSAMLLRFNPQQRWFYYPRMENHEVLVFRSFSFRRGSERPLGFDSSPCTHMAGEASRTSQRWPSLHETVSSGASKNACEKRPLSHERSVFHAAVDLEKNLLDEEVLIQMDAWPPQGVARENGVSKQSHPLSVGDGSPQKRQSCEFRIPVALHVMEAEHVAP